MTDDEPSSKSARDEREQRDLFRHKALFVVGVVTAFAGIVAIRGATAAGVVIVAVSATCWVSSGVYAIRAKRHMFDTGGGAGWRSIRGKPPTRDPAGATVVGFILIALAVGLVYGAARLAVLGPPQ